MISKVLLGFVICIYCNRASSQAADLNGTNVANAQALRSNVENHRQSFEDAKILPQIQPGAITNSHRPQYFTDTDKSDNGKTLEKSNKNLDALSDDDEQDYRPNHHLRNKHNQIKTILVKLLEKHEQKMKFAQFVPILRMLTPPQRLVMASLVSKQISSGPKNPGLNIQQVEAMFGNNPNITSDLMLPILLDIANMIRDAKDHVKQHEQNAPQAQLLRRSFNVDEDADSMDDQFYDELDDEVGVLKAQPKSLEDLGKSGKIAAKIPSVAASGDFDGDLKVDFEIEDESIISPVNATVSKNGQTMTVMINGVNQTIDIGNYSLIVGNGTEPGEQLPVAEQLRAVNRFIDRNGNIYVIARPPWNQGNPKLMLSRGSTLNRKSNNDFLMASQRRRVPGPGRKSPMELNKQKCDMFTNTLCLDSIDYPAEAIMGSIRRNQAAMAALLADFPEISADSAIDGVSAKQENKYTPEYYLNTISRREDGTGNEKSAGFMCPSTVKYARPQKARATSGQWKYIVNTGEHTQTLRLEKCLKPREPCTYLTDNFKSKCVQVYNYHRLLTWDQQNGLHMDIFKVPTCCSCHIEGYSVAFPPHAPRQESTSERFPGEDLSHNAYEEVQSSIRHTSKYPVSPQDSLSILGDNHNHIPGSSYKQIYSDENPALHDLKHLPVSNQFDTINSNFHTDVYHQGNLRNKKPPRVAGNNAGLPSYLEPPSKPPGQINNFIKTPEHQASNNNNNNNNKYKQHSTHYKRGAPGPQNGSKRPNRRPLRKKNSNAGDDQLVGATNVHENPTIINMESFEDINESIDMIERNPPKATSPAPTRAVNSRTKGSSVKFSIKNIGQTTERYRPKTNQNEHGTAVLKDISLNRRVNYNYHPIIDFFEESSKKNVASDRMDTGSVYLSSDESDWRPMAAPLAFGTKDSTHS